MRRRIIDEKTEDFKRRNVVCSDRGFLCLECGTKLGHTQSVRNHIVERHIDVDASFCCPCCHHISNTKRKIRSHISKAHPQLRITDMELLRDG